MKRFLYGILTMNNRIRNTVAKSFKDYRKTKHIDQTALADDLGCCQSVVSRIERKEIETTLSIWVTFCVLSGVNVDIIIKKKN